MTRKKILNILFWIALIISIILIIWKLFGNSPSDLSVIITFGLMLLFKIWAISDDLNEFKHEVKISFNKVKTDFEVLNNKLTGKKR